MSLEEIHVGDTGTEFIVIAKSDTLVLDISSATTKQLIFVKPDGTKLTKTATFYTNGTDGKLSYVTQSTDLDQQGSWKIQAKITLPSGTWSSSIGKFKVYANL